MFCPFSNNLTKCASLSATYALAPRSEVLSPPITNIYSDSSSDPCQAFPLTRLQLTN